MPSLREMRRRMQSVANIGQVTHALEAVSASKVRRAQQAVLATRPYADRAWQVLSHLASQAGRDTVHPLLTERREVRRICVVMVSGDRGLAGGFYSNIVRATLDRFRASRVPVEYVIVGRKGRDIMSRRRVRIVAEFSSLPADPTFADVSSIGRLVVDEFLQGRVDQIYLAYTRFVTLMRQEPTIRKMLPLEIEVGPQRPTASGHPVYIYEPSEAALINQIVPRFTALQLYQAILESLASEHAARMVAMRNATDNAHELVEALRLQYNKARQQAITSDMLDIAGGAEALAMARGNA
ncbi:MAG: ATP synthase F1 subunit gamma [Chloroflexota bacterium]